LSFRGPFTVWCVLLGATAVWYSGGKEIVVPRPAIKVGILHSLTGTMALSESAVAEATQLALSEINDAGGLLGSRIEPIIIDGQSDWPTFAVAADKLINDDQVSVVFGCWTSASRKTVKPVFEKNNHLLFYPVQYEGLEQSKNIVYTGAAPNQQITPAVKWCLENLGKRFFLIGSDYVFPRTANELIKDYALAFGAEIVGEEYALLGSDDFAGIVRKIEMTEPDVILNTVNGSSNIALFAELQRAGLTSETVPVMSFSIAENELRSLDLDAMAGHYACWNYFQNMNNDLNNRFVKNFQSRYGADRLISDPMEAAYLGVYLWAQAVNEAGTADVQEVRRHLGNQSYDAPEGLVYLDPVTQHIWKTPRIGRIRPDGQFDIVWAMEKPAQPIPFPDTRSKTEWNEYLQGLYKNWGQSWANPGTELLP